MIGAYGAIANGGVLMPRTTILKVTDSNGTVGLARPERQAGRSRRGHQPPGRLHHHRHPDRQHRAQDRTRSGASGRSTTARRRRPAAYKTGTTNDNRDVHAYGFLAPPKDPKAPGARRRRLDGQQRQRAGHRHAVARIVGAALVADHAPRSARARRSSTSRRPTGLVDGDGRRVHAACKPGPFTTKTVTELFIKGTEPTQTDDFHRDGRRSTRRAACSGRTAASGRRRRSARSTSAASRRATRAGRGTTTAGRSGPPAAPGVRRRPEGHPRPRTSTAAGFFPFGRTWGGIFAPTRALPAGAAADPAAVRQPRSGCSARRPTGGPPPAPSPGPGKRREDA